MLTSPAARLALALTDEALHRAAALLTAASVHVCRLRFVLECDAWLDEAVERHPARGRS